MNLLKYFFSRYFIKQAFIAFLISSLIILFIFLFLNISTNHNNYISVPDLKGILISDAKEALIEDNLKFEVSDSTFFNPDFPKFSVLEQIPSANSQVKKNRKIYLTINPSNYRNIAIPDIIQITKRSAIAALLSSDLELGEITLIDNIGKDMVIKIKYNNQEVDPGSLVPKKSKIDLVLGNGIKI
ncbi:MAG: hypothetical protein CMC38_01975 [Flavobacteriaceae bacterium]|nr:hypothetical protein [Flavobacteriaceae bacterium]|tara:strand:- start:357 stop:911 length:555 start_codon:yes stop_codon:yes gene_type:complete